jgi:hypothetical protein
MEEAGIEPATCRMRSDHSTPELHPQLSIMQYDGYFLHYYLVLYFQASLI